jgi:hypothetical protein
MPVNYKNGKIYKLISNHTDKIYVGSTCQPLCERKAEHKRDYNRYLNGKKNYITSFEIVKYDYCQIILIENYPCNTKEELHARERHFIEQLDCVNKVIPGRTYRQHYEDNKEIILQRKKQYRNENKDKIKQYYQDNKDHIKDKVKQYQTKNKLKISERKKQYRNDNKDKIAEHKKQYYENNKAKVLAQVSKKVLCICNSIHRYGDKSQHCKSNKHQQFMKFYNWVKDNHCDFYNAIIKFHQFKCNKHNLTQ